MRLEALLTELDDGILVENRERKILHVNRAFGGLFGIEDANAMVGSDCAEAAQAASGLFEDPAGFVELTSAQAARGERVTGTELRLADGRIFERDLIPMVDADGHSLGHCWRYRDVTLSRRATLLAEDLQRIQGEFIADPDPKAAFDGLLTTLLRASDSEYGFIGEIHHRPSGRPYLKTHAITNIAWDDASRAFFEENAPQGLEFDNLDSLFGAVVVTGEPVLSNDPANDPRACGIPDGHPPLRAFLGLPFRHGGETIGMVGIANRAGGYDEALTQLLQPVLHTCGSLVAGRRAVAQLTLARAREERLHRSLQHSQRLESLATLAGGIAHDCNNSLAVVVASVAYIETEPGLPEHTREALNDARQACDHARDIIRKLLSFTKGTESMERQNTDLVSAIGEMTRLFATTTPTQVELSFSAEGRPTCSVDRMQLQQLLLNLTTNAAQALGPSGGTIDVTIRETEVDSAVHPTLGPGRHAVISVSDDGPGVSEAIADRIFEPFFTTKETGEGTGLGLFVVQGIAEAHSGAVVLEQPGAGGATFAVYLPIVDGADTQDRDRVLIVDDDPRVLRAMRRLVRSLGYATVEASDGESALQAIDDSRVGAVISDIRMPGMSGLELSFAIHQREPALPILLVTGGPVPNPGDLGPRTTALPKPVSSEQLVAFLSRSMPEHGAPSAG